MNEETHLATEEVTASMSPELLAQLREVDILSSLSEEESI